MVITTKRLSYNIILKLIVDTVVLSTNVLRGMYAHGMDFSGEILAREDLGRDYLEIAMGGSLLFDGIDTYVALSQNNTSVTTVGLHPFDDGWGDFSEYWDKAGKIVGNFMELKTIDIHFISFPDTEYDGDYARTPDWETLTSILQDVQHKISICSSAEGYNEEVEDIQGLARAIHGHPMISEFNSQGGGFTFANMGPWCSALATLPSLERVVFGLREPEYEEEHDSLNLEPLKELLRTPALRFVSFTSFYFTNELCLAIANALEEGSSITDITFDCNCAFPDGGRAIIANALKTNASITNVKLFNDYDKPFCNTLPRSPPL
jgi:hypothetical protein